MGAFLLKLRCHAEWDREAFTRLILAMEQCAAKQEGNDTLERWIARGLWFLECTTASWVGHPDPKPTGEEDSIRLWQTPERAGFKIG